MKWFREGEIYQAVSTIEHILSTGIASQGGSGHPLFMPSVTVILINLNDLLQKASSDGNRVSFTDHVSTGAPGDDITKLINNARNAACHISSGLHNISSGKFTFNVVAGMSPNAFTIDDMRFGCDFSDDIAVFFGANKIYINRNVLRAFFEVKEIYKEHLS